MKTVYLYHLYAELMDLYGEYANVRMLSRVLEQNGYRVVVKKRSLVDVLDLTDAHGLYIGSGTEKKAKTALAHLLKNQDAFRQAYEKGLPMLLTGNSMEFVGRSIQDKDGHSYPALGMAPFTVKEGDRRLVHDQIVSWQGKRLVGFINKASQIIQNKNPLFQVEFGLGDCDGASGEGYHDKNLFATHMIGPLLVKNPDFLYAFADKLLAYAGYAPLNRELIQNQSAQTAYQITLKELTARAEKEKK